VTQAPGQPAELERLIAEALDEDSFEAAGTLPLEDLAQRHGQGVWSKAMHHLARLDLEPQAACDHFRATLARREQLASALGRPVGLRTAICDHFLTTRAALRNPVLIEAHMLLQREDSAFRDELTGVYNRRYFNNELQKEVARTRRSGLPFSLFIIDADLFKRFNDRFGHPAGDECLKQLAAIFTRSSRFNDQVCRYGGEEFTVILPRTPKANALTVAERFRANVAAHFVTAEGRPLDRITISIGVASFPTDTDRADELVRLADWALYRAKTEGRNRVSADTSDRRLHRRLAVNCGVQIVPPDAGGGTDYVCRVADISMGGLLCESNRPFPPGGQIEVVLAHPADGSRLVLDARAVRCMESPATELRYHTGFSFEHNPSPKLSALRDLLDAMAE
jgi:diguanylate cyclase (GGDEF)-like protein